MADICTVSSHWSAANCGNHLHFNLLICSFFFFVKLTQLARANAAGAGPYFRALPRGDIGRVSPAFNQMISYWNLPLRILDSGCSISWHVPEHVGSAEINLMKCNATTPFFGLMTRNYKRKRDLGCQASNTSHSTVQHSSGSSLDRKSFLIRIMLQSWLIRGLMYHSLTRPSDKCTYVRRSFFLLSLFNKSLDDRDAFKMISKLWKLKSKLWRGF